MGSATFRAGVVAVVTDDAGRIMAFERTDVPGAWQLPQGGIDQGEQPRDAAWRELGEETGLGPDHVDLVAEHPEWVVYEYPAEMVLPKGRLGQVQRWYTFRVRDRNVTPVPDGDEFGNWKWTSIDWLIEHVVDFRRPAYRAVLLDAHDW